MKTEGKATLSPVEKEDLKRLIAEVKEVVATIIPLPVSIDKKISLKSVA